MRHLLAVKTFSTVFRHGCAGRHWGCRFLRQLSLDLEQGHTVPEMLQAVQEIPLHLEDLYELILGLRYESLRIYFLRLRLSLYPRSKRLQR